MKRSILMAVLILWSSRPFALRPRPKTSREQSRHGDVRRDPRRAPQGRAGEGPDQRGLRDLRNGIRQEITGFEVVCRSIVHRGGRLAPESSTTPSSPRLFVLIFHIFDYGDAVEEGIDYFFQYGLQPRRPD